MRTPLVRLVTFVSIALIFTCVRALAAPGPQTAWNVFTLPNPQITPAWRAYAPSACQSSPEACAKDNRFWEQWDFSNFQSAIDSTFGAVKGMGKYQGIMMILPLGDSPNYWKNIRLMYTVGGQPRSSTGGGCLSEVEVRWGILLFVQEQRTGGLSEGLWNDHSSGLP